MFLIYYFFDYLSLSRSRVLLTIKLHSYVVKINPRSDRSPYDVMRISTIRNKRRHVYAVQTGDSWFDKWGAFNKITSMKTDDGIRSRRESPSMMMKKNDKSPVNCTHLIYPITTIINTPRRFISLISRDIYRTSIQEWILESYSSVIIY